MAEAMMIFAVASGLFGAIGTVIAMQGSLIDEKKSGTAAWIMSKPVSRTASSSPSWSRMRSRCR